MSGGLPPSLRYAATAGDDLLTDTIAAADAGAGRHRPADADMLPGKARSI